MPSVDPPNAIPRTPYVPLGEGIYRREMRATVAPGRVVGELVDDFHHFRATVEHDGSSVTGVLGEAPRHPWATCPGAALPLQAIVGMRLAPSLRAVGRHTSAKLQCTHMFDAAALAVARAASGGGGVVYHMAIPDRREGRTTAELWRDGTPLLRWQLEGATITGPAPFLGRTVAGGLADFAESELPAALAEAVLLLQRACVISAGRMMDLESVSRADLVQPNPLGQCHTYQPGVMERGDRSVGTVRNLTDCGPDDDLRVPSLAPAER